MLYKSGFKLVITKAPNLSVEAPKVLFLLLVNKTLAPSNGILPVSLYTLPETFISESKEKVNPIKIQLYKNFII